MKTTEIAFLLGILLIVSLVVIQPSSDASEPHGPRVDFEVETKGLILPYYRFALYLMPEEAITFRVHDDTRRSFRFVVDGESIRGSGPEWTWTAPASPGMVRASVEPEDGATPMELTLFVMRPRVEKVNGFLNGYRIGQYPSQPLQGREAYLPPEGFIEVHEETAEVWISPHFQLGPFLSKQASNYPKYIVLQEELILKLELILEKLNDESHAVEGFEILSGYRTPFYNESIGNVPYSRHAWGDAADIYIDQAEPYGRMDDLIGDDRSDWQDAQWLADFIQDHFPPPGYDDLQGGIGVYGPNPVRGPFVHVDVRGFPAAWTGSGVPN